MVKSYKDYCREAVARDPKMYGSVFNEDGTRKPLPKMSGLKRKKVPKDIPRIELGRITKNGWTAPHATRKTEKPELEVTGTEIRIRGRKQNLTTLKIPKNASHKEYNKIWMHNKRVRTKIKKLKEQYGTSVPL